MKNALDSACHAGLESFARIECLPPAVCLVKDNNINTLDVIAVTAHEHVITCRRIDRAAVVQDAGCMIFISEVEFPEGKGKHRPLVEGIFAVGIGKHGFDKTRFANFRRKGREHFIEFGPAMELPNEADEMRTLFPLFTEMVMASDCDGKVN